MRFEEAVEEMLYRRKVRRKSFLKNSFWFIGNDNAIKYSNPRGEVTNADLRFIIPLDICDWEVIAE